MKIILRILILLILCEGVVFAHEPAPGNVVINEILFNPPTGGSDYVEGFNKSDEVIDLRELIIANRNSAGDIASQKPLTRDSVFLSPGEYFVVTANAKWLRQHYSIPAGAVICEISSMPSFPDDAGTVVFLNKEDSVIDEVTYSEKWHFALITDPSGIALERISFSAAGEDKNNWTSASSASGYGTPGYKNSQLQDRAPPSGEIAMPGLFSPDNDGINDIELLQLNLKDPGYLVNSTIYDLSGRKVKYLIRNESPGLSAIYKWDGLDDKSRPLPQGIYVIITEMFNLKGNTKKFRNTVVLARK